MRQPVAARGVYPTPRLPIGPASVRALREIVGDARVVLLGESSHGAGNAFLWRAAMVEVLHREMGFEHLVMESGFYACHRAYVEASTHRDASRLGRGCAFDIWAEAAEAAPLWQTVIDSFEQEQPLQLWGMDPQLSGDVDSWLQEDMAALAKALLPSYDAALLRETLAAVRDDKRVRTPETRQAGRALLLSLRQAFERQPADWRWRSEGRAYWRHVLDSVIATEEDYWLFQLSGRTIDPTQHNLRERQMAANMVHLLKTYPRARFVVWLHNIHAARDLAKLGVVDHGDHQHDFSKSVTLGGLLAETLDTTPLAIAMFSARGRWANAGSTSAGSMPPQPADGLTGKLSGAGIERAFIDLRVAPHAWPWLTQPISAPILGIEPTAARWADHFDALFFERTMTPATSLPKPATVSADSPELPAFSGTSALGSARDL